MDRRTIWGRMGYCEGEMKIRALYDLARFLPLMSWSGNASLLGIASAVIVCRGFQGIDWPLTVLSVFVSVALQYVAHPLNDLVDYPVDVQANIDGTGRRKVLISGLATENDLRRLSGGILVITLFVAVYVIWCRPLALLFGAIGFLSVWAYNMPPLKLSYRPFPEFLIAFPVNIAMVVGISYVATGTLTLIAGVLGTVQAFMASAVLISYFAMDMQSDFLGGKVSTIVRYPGIRWCTIYPLMGTGLVSLYLVMGPGSGSLLLPVLLLGAMTILGLRMDAIWMEYREKYDQTLHTCFNQLVQKKAEVSPVPSSAFFEAWHRASGAMRRVLVHQIYLTILNGAGILLIVLAGFRG
jgi:1,4-dihydroxy-2-naphthoate octaprenyltransferase